MNYLTCRGCSVDPKTCAFRNVVRGRLRNLGVTSVKFKCAARIPLYHPGQRVRVTWPMGYGEDGYTAPVTFLATVQSEADLGRYYIRVDPGPSWSDGDDFLSEDLQSHGHANVSVTRLVPHSEPDRALCPYCRTPSGVFEDCYLNDEAADFDQSRDKCLRRQMAQSAEVA